MPENFKDTNKPNQKFFGQVFDHLIEKLPKGLQSIHHVPPYNANYMRLRVPGLPKCMYELHFSERSKHHAEYFGYGYREVLAFYYEDIGNRTEWVDAILPYLEFISNQIGLEVVSGLWGTKWACLMINLTNEKLGANPKHYSNIFAQFIQATYLPVSKALRRL